MRGPDRKPRPHPELAPLFWRVWSRCLVGDGCWEWQGPEGRYGAVRIVEADGFGAARQEGAHRAAYMASSGQTIPSGMQVNHHCDNRRCIRPDHLYLGTKSDNSKDALTRGVLREQLAAARAAKSQR